MACEQDPRWKWSLSRAFVAEARRFGRSRKPLCPLGTVGSNPTPSAAVTWVLVPKAQVTLHFSAAEALDRRCPSLAIGDQKRPRWWGADGVRAQSGVRKGCENHTR